MMKLISRSMIPFAAAVLSGAWACQQEPPPPRAQRTQYVVAVDLSTSLDSAESSRHERLLKSLASRMEYGDRLVLIKAHANGVAGASDAREFTMPDYKGSKPLKKTETALTLKRSAADRGVGDLFDSPAVNGSDLLTTIHTAGQLAAQTHGMRNVLVLLSDMLHCTRELCIEYQNGKVPDSTWIKARREQGLIRPQPFTCVVVVGADATTAHGVEVMDFWRHYFREAGTTLDPQRYVHSALTTDVLRCVQADAGTAT